MRDCVNNGSLKVDHISTQVINWADMLTEPLPRHRLQELRSSSGAATLAILKIVSTSIFPWLTKKPNRNFWLTDVPVFSSRTNFGSHSSETELSKKKPNNQTEKCMRAL